MKMRNQDEKGRIVGVSILARHPADFIDHCGSTEAGMIITENEPPLVVRLAG
jgi:hypothetical protein